jgi:HEAT repeat protein
MSDETEKATAKKHRRVRVRFIWACGIGAAGLVILFTGFLSICGAIGSGVRTISAEALREQPGDRVLALLAYVECERHSLRDRNRAVWALGQLGDSRALPLLEKNYTGKPCEHSRFLCQRELKKAIEHCRGGLNLTAYVWRGSR